MQADQKPIDDYRVYVDRETKRVYLAFMAGDEQMTVSVNAADTQRIIDALTRAVQQLRALEVKHQ